jgi:hypothetical protein
MNRAARLVQILGIMTVLLPVLYNSSPVTAADEAAVLREQYLTLAPKISHNQFQRPVYLVSTESSSTLKGDIYALVEYPFAGVKGAFTDPERGPDNWCDMLILHLNTQYCRAANGTSGRRLSVDIGKKIEQPLADAYRVGFNYRVEVSSPEYFRVDLNAESGPLGTTNYRIMLEAVTLGSKLTFLHLTYSYEYGLTARLAMKAYLATVGRDKVGFTRIGAETDGEQNYIGGVRGVVERNTMRYYLAIDAYLSALSLPADKRLEKRLSSWFDATEQYARQLHEVEKQEYMQMKYREYRRQQTTR